MLSFELRNGFLNLTIIFSGWDFQNSSSSVLPEGEVLAFKTLVSSFTSNFGQINLYDFQLLHLERETVIYTS